MVYHGRTWHFKFQSDSINTRSAALRYQDLHHFKFQSDSINTLRKRAGQQFLTTLNSNLILLILGYTPPEKDTNTL